MYKFVAAFYSTFICLHALILFCGQQKMYPACNPKVFLSLMWNSYGNRPVKQKLKAVEVCMSRVVVYYCVVGE